jgi:hypothetical protein
VTAIVTRMLAIDPSARCDLREVLGALDGGRPPAAPSQVGVFVGRHEERRRLRDAIAATDAGIVMEIHGPSGVGKTELVRRTLAELGPDQVLVLRSRCRPTESVPFQALDAVVEELGIAVQARTPDATVSDALLADVGAASVLFASLLRIADGATSPVVGDDPIETRREGVNALRRLFALAAHGRRLVVWIDDAQWADADSIELLADLVGTSELVAVRWLLTTRTSGTGTSALGQRLRTQGATPQQSVRYEDLDLAPLDPGDALSLVREVTGATLAPEAMAQIVEAGRGSPFLLASFAAMLGDGDGAALVGEGFAAVLASRLHELEADERLVLDLVALCRQPTDRGLLLEAASLGRRGIHLVQRLEGRRLVTSAPGQRDVVIDSYHDQIPETLLASVSEARRREGHGLLARAHRRRDAEPAVLAYHLHGAGELADAAHYAELGGKRAEATLAFAAAAELYRFARVWHPDLDDARAATLLEAESRTLAYSGALAAAGERYLEASGRSQGDQALELRRRGVESLLAGGHIERGLTEFRALIRRLELRYPHSESAALAGGVASLVAYLMRPDRAAGPGAAPTELLRIDACYAGGRRLADVDPSRGTYFLTRSLVRAARAGDEARLARSLCTAGGALGAVGGRIVNRIGDVLMARASRIAERLGHEELLGMIDVAYGEILMLGGRWRESLERVRRGVERLRRKPGFVFECNVGRGVVLRDLEELGEVEQEYAEGRAFLEGATSHHNAYAEIRAAQHLTVAALALDRSHEARSYLRVGFDRWAEGAFQMQHLYAGRNEALCDLYDGRPGDGAARLEVVERAFRRSVLRQIPLIRIDLLWLRGQLALARARTETGDRAPHLVAAAQATRLLDREGRRDAALRADLVRGGIASFDGPQSSESLLVRAARQAAAAGMRTVGAVATLQGCRWRGDATGADRAVSELAAYGIKNPERYAAAIVPGRAC